MSTFLHASDLALGTNARDLTREIGVALALPTIAVVSSSQSQNDGPVATILELAILLVAECTGWLRYIDSAEQALFLSFFLCVSPQGGRVAFLFSRRVISRGFSASNMPGVQRLRYCTRPFERNTRGTLGVCMLQVANFRFSTERSQDVFEHETHKC